RGRRGLTRPLGGGGVTLLRNNCRRYGAERQQIRDRRPPERAYRCLGRNSDERLDRSIRASTVGAPEGRRFAYVYHPGGRTMSNYVVVHGAFVGGSYWRDVAAILEKEGHRVEVVEQMPSAGTEPAALGDLRSDTDSVRQTIEAVGEPVVLVGHSYGGMVI